MEFQKEDLLNHAEIEMLITSSFTTVIAKMMSNKLSKYIFIHNDTMYELQENKTYQLVTNQKNKLINKVSRLIQQSYVKLPEQDVKIIELTHKGFKNIFKNSNIELYLPQLISDIEKHDIVFNVTIGEIHYNNGYINSRTGKFYKRNLTKHYVTKYIRRDYKPSTTEQRNSIFRHICKVYPNPEDLKCILLYLGSALSWKGTNDQTALFLLGKGSSGKSFILLLTKAVMGCYFVELQSDTFSVQNGKIDKILNTYKNDPQILYSWVNEPKDTKMNGSTFKVWVDGNLQTTMLYADNQFNFQHHSICATTANTMPQIIAETGTVRRILAYTHKSEFTADKSRVNEEENVYELNKYIIEDIIKKNLLDAWFDILISYCQKWTSGEVAEYTDNFKETKDTVVSSNDIIQDFIDAKLVMTNDANDKIGKDHMKNKFSEMYPDKHLTTVQVITSLTSKSILYNCNLRTKDNVRGAYYCVRFRKENEEVEDNDDDDENVDKTDKAVTMRVDDHKQIVDKLQKQIDDLKKQLENQNEPKNKVIIEAEKKPTKKINKMPPVLKDKKLKFKTKKENKNLSDEMLESIELDI